MDNFDRAFATMRQAFIDLDGDGQPDVAIPMQQPPAPVANSNAMARGARSGILDELETSAPPSQMARAGIAPSDSAQPYEPTRGEDASFALRQRGPIGNAMAPVAQGLLDYGGIPAEIATSVAMQPVRAGEAIGEAAYDPTLANVTNAGVQTALTFGAPKIAAAVGGAGYAEAARRDFAPEIFPSANAQTLTRRQQREQEMRDREAARERDAEAARIKLESEARRQEADAASQREAKAQEESIRLEQERAKKEEWDRAVARSEEVYSHEMGRVRRFSDSKGYTKQVADKIGGIAPFLAGGLAGGVARVAGAGRLGQIGAGAGGAVAATSAPLFEDAYFTDPDNPERSAYMGRGAELPPGHPRKQEFLDYGRSLPEENPVRSVAKKELYDPVRLGLSAAEGALAGGFGGDVIQGGRRVLNAMTSGRRGATGNAMAGGTSSGTPRVLIKDDAGRHRTPDGRFASPPPRD